VRRLRYQVATSLEGYIAGPNGEFDWIVMDPDIDFGARFAQFDTALMGRKTFLTSQQEGGAARCPVSTLSSSRARCLRWTRCLKIEPSQRTEVASKLSDRRQRG
jgi:dihydrofolate reductase